MRSTKLTLHLSFFGRISLGFANGQNQALESEPPHAFPASSADSEGSKRLILSSSFHRTPLCLGRTDARDPEF